jgi:hypothetical protein
LGRSSPLPSVVDHDQLASLVRISYASGARGILFRSNSRLDGADVAARRRAALLELQNRRLQVAAPWIAGGARGGGASSSDQSATAAVLWLDRSRLLVPIDDRQTSTSEGESNSANSASLSPSAAPNSFVVPGIPDSSQAFAMTLAGLRLLDAKRVAGGTRITLDAFDEAAVITQDAQVISGLRQLFARDGLATIRLAREVLSMRASDVSEIGRRLSQLGYDIRGSDAILRGASTWLQQADAMLAAGRIESAFTVIATADRRLSDAAKLQSSIVRPATRLSSHALAESRDMLGEFAHFLRTSESLRPGDNVLYGGDFENLDELTQFGWQHLFDPAAADEVRVELSADRPHHGRYCLRLAQNGAPQRAEAGETARMRIVSPAVPVAPGQILEISGWVRVSGLENAVTPVLRIEESLGGPEMHLPVASTSGWEPFQIIRAATQTEVRIAFSLVEPGIAELDAVVIRPLQMPTARRLPAPIDGNSAIQK